VKTADDVETGVQVHIAEEMKRYETLQVVSSVFSTLLIASMIWGIYRFERRRAADMQLVASANTDLQAALNEVKTIRGIIPICSYCKKIRDKEGLFQLLRI